MTDFASPPQSSAFAGTEATDTSDTVDTLAGLQAGNPLAAIRSAVSSRARSEGG
jgi:hypothetical protein